MRRLSSIGGGWYRCSALFTPSGSTALTIGLLPLDGGWTTGDPWSSYSFVGNTTSGVNAFGSQVEVGGAPSSYIPTPSGAATRSADLLSTTDATLLSAQAWVMEVGELQASTQATLLGVNTVVGLGATSGNALRTTDGGTQTTANTTAWTSGNKAGLAYDLAGRVSVVLDGGTVATAANTAERPGTLYLGNTNSGASDFLNGHIRNWTAYSSLNDTDLQTFTVNITYTSGAGSSAGTDTATAVGIWTQEGVGSSAGSNTSSATAAPIQAKVGSAAGTNTATATGAWI